MAKSSRLRSLPYYGGKRGYGKATWIAEHLPWAYNSTYVEPFAGMAGVLLARRPVKLEIVNDLNERIVNWWRAVRDEPEQLAWLIDRTPHSRVEYQWATENIDNPELPAVRRALAFTVAVDQSMMHADGKNGQWQKNKDINVGSVRRPEGRDIDALAFRLRKVQLECMDAVKLIEQVADYRHAVVYADPPYPTADTSPYKESEVDVDRLSAALLSIKGAAAISGYGDEWNHLGWRREERGATLFAANIHGANANRPPRTEVLWINAAADQTKPRLL